MLKKLFVSSFATLVVFVLFYSTKQYNAANHIGDIGKSIHSYDYAHANKNDSEGYLVKVNNVDLYPGVYDVKCFASYEESEDFLVIVSSPDDKNFLYAADAGVAAQGMSVKVGSRIKAQIGVWYKPASEVTIERLDVHRKLYLRDAIILLATFAITFIIATLVSKLSIAYSVCLLFVVLVSFHLTNYKWSGEISGLYTDHVSHINSTMLFDRVGIDVLMKPVDKIFRDINESGCALHQSIGWSRFPRAYPPGVYALHYPFAALAWLDVPMDVLKVFPLVLYLLCAHVLLYIYFTDNSGDGDEDARVRSFIIVPIVFFSVVQWSMFGFYDIFSVLFVYLAFRSYFRSDFAYFVFWSSLAVFFHYRALWYFIFYAYGFFALFPHFLKNKALITKQQSVLLISSLCISVISLYSFKNLFPLLSNYPCQNLLSVFSANKWHVISVLFLLVSTIIVCFRKENLHIVCSMIGSLFVLLMTKQFYPWHSLFVIPLLMVSTRNVATKSTTFAVLLFSLIIILSSGANVLEVNMAEIMVNKYFQGMTSFSGSL